MIHRKLFFDKVGRTFGHVLTDSQTEGIAAILDEWETHNDEDLRRLAYILGTAHHETDKTFQPIEEYDKGGARLYAKPDAETGLCYYGRGFVQLTWRKNYQLAGSKLELDLDHHPELACQIVPAARILVQGMLEGWFTGARLNWYFTESKCDWINARRIVNGLDRAELVAGYAKRYLEALGEPTI